MRGRISVGATLCAILLGATAAAQTPYQTRQSTLSDVEFHATNYGVFGLDVAHNTPGFAVPRGSGITYLFGAGLWFGAIKKVGEDTLRVAFITYNPNTGYSWAAPDGVEQPATAEQLYHSVRYDRSTGKPLAAGSGDATWPLWLAPGREPRPADPGTFESIRSSRKQGSQYHAPAFLPGVAEQFVTSFNDRSVDRYESHGTDSASLKAFPLGLSIRQHIYAWDSGPFKDLVMIKYEITNRSPDTLLQCVASQMTDADLGISTNDHASYFQPRPDLRAALAWSEPEAKPHKVLATAIIEGPLVDEEGYIERAGPAARKRYRMEGRLGTFQSWTIEDDPQTPAQRYDFMSDRTQLDLDNGAGDTRLLMGTTRFNMRPFDTVHFTVIYAVVNVIPSNPSTLDSVVTLLEAVNDAYYSRESFLAVPSEHAPNAGDAVTLVPNPGREHAAVRFTTTSSASATLCLMNDLGEEVLRRDLGRLEPGTYEESLDLAALPAGPYLVSITAGSTRSTARLTVVR